MKIEITDEVTLNAWCVTYAIKARRRGAKPESIIADAIKYRNFIYPHKCEIIGFKNDLKK